MKKKNYKKKNKNINGNEKIKKPCIYELPHEFPNNIRLRILRNYKI